MGTVSRLCPGLRTPVLPSSSPCTPSPALPGGPTWQRSQRGPVTPALHRQCPVRGSQPSVPQGEQSHPAEGGAVTTALPPIPAARSLSHLARLPCSPHAARGAAHPTASPKVPLGLAEGGVAVPVARHRPPRGRTGAVARQQGVAVEAGRARLAARPGGVSQAAAAGACQRVAVLEQQVGVAVAAAVAGLTRATQHQRVAEEAGRTPGAGAESAAELAPGRGRGQWLLRARTWARAGSAAGAGSAGVSPTPGPRLRCCAGRARARPAAHRSQEVPA